MKILIIATLVGFLTSCSLNIVSPPKTPDGPATGKVGQKLTYSTKGTDPLKVHEYLFDWGDATESDWKSDTEQSHVYTAAKTYTIKAKEKCPAELFETDWSKGKTVKVVPK
jgi:hypothetical protein